ncbi:hypothetical protein CCACVL1_01051, partial [Corchorus capsularis]
AVRWLAAALAASSFGAGVPSGPFGGLRVRAYACFVMRFHQALLDK